MNNIFGILLISIMVIFVFMIVAIWFMNYFLRFYIGRKHSLLEEIVEMNRIPMRWTQKFDKQLAKVAGDAQAISSIREHAGHYYLRRLTKLEKYVKRSTLVQGDETRQILLESIDGLSHEWGNRKHGFRIKTTKAQGQG